MARPGRQGFTTRFATLALAALCGLLVAGRAFGVDSDSDGLPDDWEMQFFGSLDQGADTDFDGDGATNLAEYQLGTDPTQADNVGPVISAITTVPTKVRLGLDTSVTLMALASDVSRGNSRIVGAEYYIGNDPGTGNGIPMEAADGAFDSAIESVRATVDTSAWTEDVTLRARARDALGYWGSSLSYVVRVVDDFDAPGAITDFDAEPAGSFEFLSCTVSDFSSQAAGFPITALLDGAPATCWQTQGSAEPETEYVVLDALATKKVSAVTLLPGVNLSLFPDDFKVEVSTDGAAWTRVAAAADFRVKTGIYWWQFEPVDARYVRISGPGVYDRSTGLYAWQIADAYIWRGDGVLVNLSWTAVADDGYLGSAAGQYDVRYLYSPLDADSFAGATQVSGLGAPRTPGTPDGATVRINATDSIYIGMKVGDDVPNWSELSNVVRITPYATGFASTAPAEAANAAVDAPPIFQFEIEPVMVKVFIDFSSASDFVTKATLRDGHVDRTLRFPVKPGVDSWTPSSGQWKAIKRIVASGGVVHWRLEGYRGYAGFYGPTRSLVFDTGEVSALSVSNAHASGADEAVWPDVDDPPVFTWEDDTSGMGYFFVDVSSDEAIPIADRKSTLTLGKRGIEGESYTPNAAEWKKIRRLAAQSGGVLYWRVRALDTDRAFSAASDAARLVIDGGQWAPLDAPAADPGTGTPSFAWQHTAQGYAGYRLEFCADGQFQQSARYTLTAPSKGVPASPYVLSSAELRRLQQFAIRNGAATLHWRVRAEDGDRSFAARSASAEIAVP